MAAAHIYTYISLFCVITEIGIFLFQTMHRLSFRMCKHIVAFPEIILLQSLKIGLVPMSVGRAGGFLLPFGSNRGERDCLVIPNS